MTGREIISEAGKVAGTDGKACEHKEHLVESNLGIMAILNYCREQGSPENIYIFGCRTKHCLPGEVTAMD